VCFLLRNASKQNSESLLLFFSTEQYSDLFSLSRNSEHFSLKRNGLERNSESLLLFLIHGMKFWAFWSSAKWFGMEFWEFSVPRNSRNSVGTNHLFRLLRLPRNNFFVGNSKPTLAHVQIQTQPSLPPPRPPPDSVSWHTHTQVHILIICGPSRMTYLRLVLGGGGGGGFN
jgi:hypothetical protein